ncbi:MAG: FAD-dependent monooxygenase [Myxococcaceae bacterium]|nr:FAD-dependent monooxygenase [Myxococcaceae bacterium]
MKLDVAVVGTGTAGSATALFLARAGHHVTLYERVPDPQPLGAGIMLQPSGMAVLEALGLREQVVSRGERIEALVAETTGGRRVLDLSYADLQAGLYGVGLHRGVLFDALFQSAKKQLGITLKLGVDVEDLAWHRDGHWLVEAKTGRRFGPHQLVVVANGARSSLRDDTSQYKTVDRYPFGALWAVVPDPEHRFTGRLYQVVRGTKTMIGLLPTGLGPTGSTPLVSMFYSLKASELEAFRQRDFGEWKAHVLEAVPSSGPVLDQLDGHDSLLFADYHDVVMWPWNVGRVVYVGDSAHATSPQLGQGANLALVDAHTLAHALGRGESIEDGLYLYSRLRRSHLAWYQFVTRWLTPFFQSDFWPLGIARDVAMGLMCRLPVLRGEMVAMMAGISLGPFRRWSPPST